MSTRKAVVHESSGVSVLKHDVPVPELPGDNWVLVKTKAVALNPTDWKGLERATAPGAIAGCDYAGIVEKVGSNAGDLKVGDRICGFVRGGDPADHSNGSFAQYIKAKVGIHLRPSINVSYEDAATLGIGITTVAQGLYQSLGLPLPPAKVSSPTTILIYGASTATGTLAVQFAKLSGCEVIATASPHNFDLVKKLGADQVFSYKDADCGAKIRAATNGTLKLAFDCISEGASPGICAAALSSTGGHYSSLLAVNDFPRDDVKLGYTLAYTALGEQFSPRVPASQADYEFGARFWKVAEGLLNDGSIKAHPTEVRKGLEGVPQGLQDLRNGKVSGVKLVYTVE